MQADNYLGPVYGLKTLVIPENVTTIRTSAFFGTELTEVVVPKNVKSVGSQAFAECSQLKTVRYEAEEVGEELFTHCTSLCNLTLARSVKKLGARIFPYCENLRTITYEGTLAEWQAIPKGTTWDGYGPLAVAHPPLERIQCQDGYMVHDAAANEWKVGEE